MNSPRHSISQRALHLCIAISVFSHLISLQAHIFTFKAGATFEGEIAEFKGTNVVLVTSAKDGKPYSLTTSLLSEDDQKYLAMRRRELESEITGAFGVRLGQPFRPELATSKHVFGDGVTLYGFKPQNPLPSFSEYWVRVTPRSNHVFYIVADGRLNWEKAYEERRKILAALEEKYGKAVHRKKDLRSAGTMEYDTMTQGDRVVEVRFVTGNSPSELTSITISYEDKALRKQAEKESGGQERDGLKKRL